MGKLPLRLRREEMFGRKEHQNFVIMPKYFLQKQFLPDHNNCNNAKILLHKKRTLIIKNNYTTATNLNLDTLFHKIIIKMLIQNIVLEANF
jgi:hypothetical protein